MISNTKITLWLVYDGECPICQAGAKIYQIKQSVGNFHTINSRAEKDHFIMQEINKAGLNLDNGMVIKYKKNFYQGAEALRVMADLSSSQGAFNKINKILFQSKAFAKICYPLLQIARNIAISIKGSGKINNLVNLAETATRPIFQPVFAESWQNLPTVLKKHYANHPYTNDIVQLKGLMDIKMSKLTRLLKPLFKLLGTLVPYEGANIPTTVYSKSKPSSPYYHLERHFHFPGQKTYKFCSKFINVHDNEVIEVTSFGIGWRCHYIYENKRVSLIHKGYCWCIFNFFIPIPLTLLFGKVEAWEEAVDDSNFKMCMKIIHPIFGKTFEYKGQFQIL